MVRARLPGSPLVLFSLAYLGLRRALELVVWSRRSDLDKEVRSSSCVTSSVSSNASWAGGCCIARPIESSWLPSVGSAVVGRGALDARH